MAEFFWEHLICSTVADFEECLQECDINSRDMARCYILAYIHTIPLKHLDIMFKYGFKPYIEGVNYLYWPNIDGNAKSLLFAQKLLDNDHEGKYVRMKQIPAQSWKLMPYGTKLEEIQSRLSGFIPTSLRLIYPADIDDIKMHYELLTSHRNRHFTFFEHLQYLLEEKDINKKQRN